MDEKLLCIELSAEFHSNAQAIYFDSVVAPELLNVLSKHAEVLAQLGEE